MRAQPKFSEQDSDLLLYKWRLNNQGYPVRTINPERHSPMIICAHREVCLRAFGRLARARDNEVCDHIDGDKLNNMRDNLRITTKRENALNSRKIRSSPNITLHKQSGRWQVQFRQKYIGLYKTPSEAACVVAKLRATEVEHRLASMPEREALRVSADPQP